MVCVPIVVKPDDRNVAQEEGMLFRVSQIDIQYQYYYRRLRQDASSTYLSFDLEVVAVY